MRTWKILAALLPFAAAPLPAGANNPSLAKCGDLSASARDVAHHCRRALSNGGLSDAQTLAAGINLGDALLALGQTSAALDAFNAAEHAGPARVELHMGRADAYEALGDRRRAAEDLDRALVIAPGSVDVRLERGAFYLRLGEPGAALEEFSAALRLDAEDADALFNRGLAHLQLGEPAKAEQDFTAVLREYPNDAGAWHHRARAREGRDEAGALSDYDKAASLSPEWAEPWFRSGKMLDASGRTEAANQRFRRAFELGYRDNWLLDRIRSFGG